MRSLLERARAPAELVVQNKGGQATRSGRTR